MPEQPLAEIFGFPADNLSDEAERYRTNKLCPYNNKVPSCTKDKAKNPLGVCTVFDGDSVAITCPIRFRQDWFITDVLGGIFTECHRVLRKDWGRLVFTFHHWNPKGWASLTLALKRGGFVLLNRYVVHAENPISVHISNLKALMHDAVLVLAPSEAGHRQEWGLPAIVDKSDSQRFCADCATVLGWMLNSELGDDEIEPLWRKLLESSS